jgi:tetratricopeptide (TPR) repeat protein
MTKESISEALQLFYFAIEIDPESASPYAMIVRSIVLLRSHGWTTEQAYDIAEIERLAQRAVQLGREDASSLCRVGFGLAFLTDDPDRGAAVIDRALVLNPNLAEAWYFSGLVNSWFGKSDQAINHLTNAMRLNPLDPLFWAMQGGIALAHFVAGRYEDVYCGRIGHYAKPGGRNYHMALRVAAASNALIGRLDEAKEYMGRLRSVDPELRISNLRGYVRVWRQEHFARLAEGLRKAGLPE